MPPTDLSVQAHIDLVQQHLIASEHFYRHRFAAAATKQMMKQLEPAPERVQRSQLLCVLGRKLIRGFWKLFSVVLSRPRSRHCGSQSSAISDEPNLIDGEVVGVCYGPAPICQSSALQNQWEQNTHFETWVDGSRSLPFVSHDAKTG